MFRGVNGEMMETQIQPAPVTPKPQAPLHLRYARVLALVGAGAQYRRTRQSQHGSLEEAGRAIHTLTDFRQLCALDLRETWCHDRDFKVRTVHHRVETWERVYAHWRKWRGGPAYGPVIIIAAIDKSGTYSIRISDEQRSSDERLWDKFEAVCKELMAPPHLVAGFRSACERDEARLACMAAALKSKVGSAPDSASHALPGPSTGLPPGRGQSE